MRITFEFRRLTLEDRKSLAVSAADKSSLDSCAVAAFYCLAAGDSTAAAPWLARAGGKTAEVRAAFGD